MKTPVSERFQIVLFINLLLAAAAGCETGLNEADTRAWARHVIPLPKNVSIERTVQVAPADVAVRVRPGATDVEWYAARKLGDRFGVKVQTRPAGAGKFEILLGICDAAGRLDAKAVAGADKLARLPNSDQAYVIAPDGPDRLILAGLTEKGESYAATTLEQLLDGGPSGDKVTLPIVRVTDWPDMTERGIWNAHTFEQMAWMAQRKLNLIEQEASNAFTVTPDGRGRWTPPPTGATDARYGFNDDWIRQARLDGVKFVPFIAHFPICFPPSGAYRLFPEIRGRKYSPRKGTLENVNESPCFALPQSRRILSDWICDLADHPGVTDVCVWLTEGDEYMCQCPVCKPIGQFVMETRAILEGWRKARARHPGFGLRILLTQGSHPYNDKVIAEIPPEVHVTYYDGGYTYNVTKDPMIYPLLEMFAASGRWLGVCPTMEPNYDVPWPWTAPTLVNARMTEFVDKKLRLIVSYAPSFTNKFNMAGQAEWGWNAHGRSPHEFAAAYATREGFKNPDAFADWAMLVDDAGWDVQGFGFSFKAFFDEITDLVRTRRRPELGKGRLYQGVFRYFPIVQHFDEDLAACERAMKIARRFDWPDAVIETRCTTALLKLLRDAYDISSVVSMNALPTDRDRRRLGLAMKGYSGDGMELLDAYHEYLKAHGLKQQTWCNVDDMLATSAVSLALLLKPFGVRDPYQPYWWRKAADWDNATFDEGRQKAVHKVWEVTSLLAGAGEYLVKPTGVGGCDEVVDISRVALAWAPKDQPDRLTDVSEDKHPGSTTGTWSQNELYALRLDHVDPNRRYFIVADLYDRVSRYSDKDQRPYACKGTVFFAKKLPPGPSAPDLPLLPADQSMKLYYEGPTFAPGKIRVGVIDGGFGADTILTGLAGVSGLDAQAVYLRPNNINKCDVIVYPQPRGAVTLDMGAAWLRDYLQNGGHGLIVTHDAAGYRGQAVIAPDVCAKGVDHVNDSAWTFVQDHPVAAGFKKGQDLTKTYFDLIALEAGPRGTVLARGVPSGLPAVICGQSGKGRYVACGLALGLGGPGGSEVSVSVSADERKLLENAIRWAASGKH